MPSGEETATIVPEIASRIIAQVMKFRTDAGIRCMADCGCCENGRTELYGGPHARVRVKSGGGQTRCETTNDSSPR
jgi:hypothetical protein